MKVAFFLAGILVGGFAYHAFWVSSPNPDAPLCPESVFVNQFACIEPILAKGEYVNAKQKIIEYIDEQKRLGTISEAGIYFRDLRNGPTMGINEYAEFSTASLLKVPVLITYLNLLDSDPTIFDHEIALREGFETNEAGFKQHYAPPTELEKDTAYTVGMLLDRVVQYSDNVASEMLRAYLRVLTPDDILGETYKELGLVPDEGNGDYVISVKRYSSMFRILFNASYLSLENSEKALEMLSSSTFDTGIVAGVPEGIIVANKFGERGFYSTDPSVPSITQLHDCGIVYYPNNPYLICIMTQGNSFETLERVIQDISRMMYEEVDSRRLPNAPLK